MPVSEWNGDEIARHTEAAAEDGLNAASIVLVESVKKKLGRRGATYKMLRSGRKILKQVEKLGYFKLGRNGKANSTKKRQYIAAVEEQQFGAVDPPDGYPRKRTGNLSRAADYEKTGPLRRMAGNRPVNAAHIYGVVHEFGNATTPARPVWGPSWRGEGDAMFEAFVKQSAIAYQSETPTTGAE